MQSEPFVLIDLERMLAFTHLASGPHSLRQTRTSTDESGVTWTWVEVGHTALGLSWLGPGRVWDATWIAANQNEHAHLLEAVKSADSARHRAEFGCVIANLRLGGLAGRVLHAVHLAVLFQKSSLITMADVWLGEMVWGQISKPQHWRSVLKEILRGLTWLHVLDLPGGGTPVFGAASVLFTHFGDFLGTPEDVCQGDCGARRDLRHHHFQVDIGPGFLGILEAFGRDNDGSGIRDYQFPVGTRRASRFASLRKIGKSGRLVSVFTPALLGDPTQCRTLSEGAHRILQTLVRETTRPTKFSKEMDPRAELVSGNRVRTYSGRAGKPCKLLAANVTYVGFNGNGKRRAMGYRLRLSEWSWLSKAGYAIDAVPDFLDDLAEVATALELVVVGVGPANNFSTFDRLCGMAQSAAGLRELARIDVRVFTRSDYVMRWSRYFGFVDGAATAEAPGDLDVHAAMRSRNVSGRMLAAAIGCDPSFMAKILKGTKRWPKKLLKKARKYLACDPAASLATSDAPARRKQPTRSTSTDTR